MQTQIDNAFQVNERKRIGTWVYFHKYLDNLTVLFILRPAASDLETYMSYLEKVLKAKKYFDTYSPNSKEMKEIVCITCVIQVLSNHLKKQCYSERGEKFYSFILFIKCDAAYKIVGIVSFLSPQCNIFAFNYLTL